MANNNQWPCHCTRPGNGDQEIRMHPQGVAQCETCGARQVDWHEFARHDAAIRELVAAARDMVEQVGAFIDLDERVDDPCGHDLFDVHAHLVKAIEAMESEHGGAEETDD